MKKKGIFPYIKIYIKCELTRIKKNFFFKIYTFIYLFT